MDGYGLPEVRSCTVMHSDVRTRLLTLEPLSAREAIAERVAESMFAIDMALDIIHSSGAARELYPEDELRRIFDGLNTILRRISN